MKWYLCLGRTKESVSGTVFTAPRDPGVGLGDLETWREDIRLSKLQARPCLSGMEARPALSAPGLGGVSACAVFIHSMCSLGALRRGG